MLGPISQENAAPAGPLCHITKDNYLTGPLSITANCLTNEDLSSFGFTCKAINSSLNNLTYLLNKRSQDIFLEIRLIGKSLNMFCLSATDSTGLSPPNFEGTKLSNLALVSMPRLSCTK